MKNTKDSSNKSGAAPGAITIEIGTLILRGFASTDRATVAEVVERELARLFQESDTLPTFGQDNNLDCLKGGAFNTPARPAPAALGAQVAGTVYNQITALALPVASPSTKP